MLTQPGSGHPVSYDPCSPITFAINPSGVNPDVVAMVVGAAETVSAVSGFELAYLGPTTLRPFSDRDTEQKTNRVATVTIGFASEAELPDLAGDVAGYGGSTAVGIGRVLRYSHGDIALDRDLFATILSQPRGPAQAAAIVMHEWGHVLGLDHVEDIGQLMNTDNVGLTSWGSGDLTGFEALAANPCQ